MAISFFGGLHFNAHKIETCGKSIELLQPPEQLVMPMSMHIGAPCIPLVKKGDKVKLGQKIGESTSPISAPIHSSVSGTVSCVEPRLHPNGSMVTSVVIDNDFNDTPDDSLRPFDGELTSDNIVEIVKNAGIVGLGGATFPTHFKISSGLGKVDTVIINAAECEPYITSDHRLMLEHPEDVILGARILKKAFSLDKIYIGIEKNKPDAIEILNKVKDGGDIVVFPLKTRYPQGAEKQLIQSVTGREVPSGGLPADVGCAVFNVDTVSAIARAVYQGMPVIRRIVTVSGSGVKNPKNLHVRIGTPLQAVFDACGGLAENTEKILMGGPMMGVAQYDLNVPVLKNTNALLAFTNVENSSAKDPQCIRCGRCASVCPIRLQPLMLNLYATHNMFDLLQKNGIKDCIECGCCAYICPGRLPLVHTFRMAKQKLIDHEKTQNSKKEAEK